MNLRQRCEYAMNIVILYYAHNQSDSTLKIATPFAREQLFYKALITEHIFTNS